MFKLAWIWIALAVISIGCAGNGAVVIENEEGWEGARRKPGESG